VAVPLVELQQAERPAVQRVAPAGVQALPDRQMLAPLVRAHRALAVFRTVRQMSVASTILATIRAVPETQPSVRMLRQTIRLELLIPQTNRRQTTLRRTQGGSIPATAQQGLSAPTMFRPATGTFVRTGHAHREMVHRRRRPNKAAMPRSTRKTARSKAKSRASARAVRRSLSPARGFL
jgi:hypothetical protein